jgi:DNA polymerase-3 subunit epsilon
LLDAEILADVYLLLTGGQVTLGLGEELNNQKGLNARVELDANRPRLNVIKADEEELIAHENKLDHLDGIGEVGAVWRVNTKGETG